MNVKEYEDYMDSIGALKTPPEYVELVKGKLFANAIHLIYGTHSSGKSYFAFNTCLEYLENGGDRAVRYYDGDGTGSTQKIFVNRIDSLNGMFDYRFINGANDLLDRINQLEISDSIIIIDSVKDFFGGMNMDKNEDVIKFYSWIKRLLRRNNTVLLIAHATEFFNNSTKKNDLKLQGNKNGFLSSAQFVFKASTNKEVSVEKSRSVMLNQGSIVNEAVKNYEAYDGVRLEDVKKYLGVYNDDAVKEQFLADKGVLWDVEKDGRKHVFKVL